MSQPGCHCTGLLIILVCLAYNKLPNFVLLLWPESCPDDDNLTSPSSYHLFVMLCSILRHQAMNMALSDSCGSCCCLIASENRLQTLADKLALLCEMAPFIEKRVTGIFGISTKWTPLCSSLYPLPLSNNLNSTSWAPLLAELAYLTILSTSQLTHTK